jgi:hypothetical protein
MMTTEQYLHFTAHLDWMTPDEILAYLDGLGLWPAGTSTAVKVREITAVLLAEDASGMPLVANLRRPDGQRVFKNDSACTLKDLAALKAFHEAQGDYGKARATEARDTAVQHGMAHRALPWEGVPDA